MIDRDRLESQLPGHARGGNVAPPVLARLFSDHPVRSDEKLYFEFEGLAKTLAQLALNPENPTPFTAVVRGGWGRGKTTLLRRVEHLFASNSVRVVGDIECRQVITLWFNAWKYPNDDTVLAGLLGELLLKYQAGGATERLKKFIADNRSKGILPVLKYALPAPVLAALNALGLDNLGDSDSASGRYAELYRSRAFYDTFRGLFGSLSHLLFATSDLVRPDRPDDVCWDEQSRKKWTVAIFLDDLDRCREARVVEVLEAINLFLDLPGVCFYLGLDSERLMGLLPRTFQGHADQFLEKIVQVSLELPAVSEHDAATYIREMIHGTPLQQVLNLEGTSEEEREDEVEILAETLESLHPRHIKRFLNDLSVGLAVLMNTNRLATSGEALPKGTNLVPASAVVAWHLLAEVVPRDRWNELRTGASALRPFLLSWVEQQAQADGEPESERFGRGVQRLRETGRLDRHVAELNGLSDDQLGSLILLATPPPLARATPQAVTPAPAEMDHIEESQAESGNSAPVAPEGPLTNVQRAILPAAAPRVAPPQRRMAEVSDDDLRVIQERCRVKAKGARWAAQRGRQMAEGADFELEIAPLDLRLIEEARNLPDCFLWMNHRSGPLPSDMDLLDDLGGCFEVNADALDLALLVLGDREPSDEETEDALNLMAEAQASLRVAVERVGYDRDPDQYRTYQWIRARCHDARIYIQRYMRLSDVPDPTGWADLGQRIEALESTIQARHQQRRERESGLKRISYHLKPILKGHPGDRAYDWQKIIATVDEIVAAGLPPSAVELRELLLPAVDLLPDLPVPLNFERALREIDRFLASRPTPPSESQAAEDRPEVGAVAELLRGRTLVLIGGERRPQAQEALRRAFELKEVDWVEIREHASIAPIEAHVARPEVAVVVLAIRWSGHSFGEAKVFCDQYDKPLVRLPGGYNPGQVAVQVLRQCGGRLAAES